MSKETEEAILARRHFWYLPSDRTPSEIPSIPSLDKDMELLSFTVGCELTEVKTQHEKLYIYAAANHNSAGHPSVPAGNFVMYILCADDTAELCNGKPMQHRGPVVVVAKDTETGSWTGLSSEQINVLDEAHLWGLVHEKDYTGSGYPVFGVLHCCLAAVKVF
jgi:hypothetical protein